MKLNGFSFAATIIGVVAVIFIGGYAISEPTSYTPPPTVGAEKRIASPGGAILAQDMAANDAYVRAVQAHDTIGQQELILGGKIFNAEDGARVLILENHGVLTKVRVLSGVNEGRAGYTITEWIQ